MHLDGQWISQDRAEMIERRERLSCVADESGLSSQRATESFGNEQRRLKPDSGCFGAPLSNEPLHSSTAWMALCSRSFPSLRLPTATVLKKNFAHTDEFYPRPQSLGHKEKRSYERPSSKNQPPHPFTPILKHPPSQQSRIETPTQNTETEMRKLKIMEHISLDGVIQVSGENGDFPYSDWTAPYRTPAGREALLAAHGGTFDLLLGRRTYDMWSGFWPKAPSSPMADGINAATKYIATHRPESLEWGPFESLGPEIVEGIRRIKSQDGPDLILWGSSTLTSTLLEHGLADEACWWSIRSCWVLGSASLRREPRHAHSILSTRKHCRPASSSIVTR